MDDESRWKIVNWVWNNRAEVAERVKRVYHWVCGDGSGAGPGSHILILGAGGVGKTTLSGLISGQFDFLTRPPWEYQESYDTETAPVAGETGQERAIELVIPPGQDHRRAGTWGEVFADLGSGKFRGVVLTSAFGYHSLGATSFKSHRLYRGNPGKRKFLAAFLDDRRAEELAVLGQIIPHLQAAAGKVWLLSLVTKQDVWWAKRADVKRHYEEGAYRDAVRQLLSHRGAGQFRHEFAYASLVIGNFVTGLKETLQPNTAGYDHHAYVESVHRLFETLDALRTWEGES